jgi:glycosyltransferase involved in cell wall biosynthesis
LQNFKKLKDTNIMTIVYVTKWFSEGMGYIDNRLPKAMASLGHEVHVITSTAQVYYNASFYNMVYKDYLGEPVLQPGVYNSDNVTIHRLPFLHIREHMILKGLITEIRKLEPDIVHVFEHTAIDTYRLALLKLFLPFRFYTGNHFVHSVFPIAKNWHNESFIKKMRWRLFSRLPGKIIANLIEKCYAVTKDAGDIAVQFMGVPLNKVQVSTLGTNTDLYYPWPQAEKDTLRKGLGFTENDIVCIYTGRFTPEKNPLIVAEAIEELAIAGKPFKGIFVGEGIQREAISEKKNCLVFDFIPYPELPKYYQAADIAVWPAEESTSQIDAVASGLNLILTDNIKAYTYIENDDQKEDRLKIVSRFYSHFNKKDLEQQLLSLADPEYRKRLSKLGVQEIVSTSSWYIIAERWAKDYSAE